MQGTFWIANSKDTAANVARELIELQEQHGYVTVKFKVGKPRTPLQNNAEHKYFELLANKLNDAGYDVGAVLKHKTVDVPWTKELVKTVLWKGIQEAMFEIASTADLSTVQTQGVYKVLDKWTSEKLGVSVAWPERLSQGQSR